MNILLRMLIAGVLLILTVGTGIWMSSLGKPYRPKLFTFHKIIALVTTANMLFFILGLPGMESMEGPSVLLLLPGGLSILALFVSGVMLGNGKVSYHLASKIHSFTSILAIVTIGLFLFMMIWTNMGIPI